MQFVGEDATEQQEWRRQTWIAYYLASGEEDEARALGWDSEEEEELTKQSGVSRRAKAAGPRRAAKEEPRRETEANEMDLKETPPAAATLMSTDGATDEQAVPCVPVSAASERGALGPLGTLGALWPSSSKPRLFAYDVSSDPPGKARRRARAIPINSSEPTRVENDMFEGHVVLLSAGDAASPHEEYFANKTRRWEFRMQGRFKALPKGTMFGGGMLQDEPMGQAPSRALRMLARVGESLLRSVASDVHFTVGERGASSRSDDAELPHAVAGIRGLDQLIVTPAGTPPPSLQQDLTPHGGVRAKMSKAAWAEHADAAVPVRKDATYTFGFWGASRFVNLANWRYEVAGGLSTAMEPAFPQHVVVYALDGDCRGPHRESKKAYIMDLLVVSSKALPLHQSMIDRFEFSGSPLHPGAGGGR